MKQLWLFIRAFISINLWPVLDMITPSTDIPFADDYGSTQILFQTRLAVLYGIAIQFLGNESDKVRRNNHNKGF